MADTQANARQNLVEQPIWDDLYGEDADGPYLVGGRCAECGFVTLAVREICPGCLASGAMAEEPIGRRGTLYTSTVIHQAPEGFEAPFAVGYVDLDEGVRVFAHLDNTPESRAIGSTVELTIALLKNGTDDAQLSGPRYRTKGD